MIAFALLWALPVGAFEWDAYGFAKQQRLIVQSSTKQLGRQNVRAAGKRFRSDCSGFVKAVMYDVGHSLDDFYRTYRIETNGVNLIHEYVARVGTLYTAKKPHPGDLVFFSNTYDKNKNRRADDRLTHIGVVKDVDREGTVTFVHYIHNRVREGKMNLKKPTTYVEGPDVLNHYLRRKSSYTSKTLAGELFESFGTLRAMK